MERSHAKTFEQLAKKTVQGKAKAYGAGCMRTSNINSKAQVFSVSSDGKIVKLSIVREEAVMEARGVEPLTF